MYYSLGNSIAIYLLISQILSMHYIVLEYITLYNIVQQSDKVCLCPLHGVVIIYSNF